MGRFLMLIGIAVCTCLLVLWLTSPRLLTPNAPAANPSPTLLPASSGADGNASGSQLAPITASGSPGSNALPNIAPLKTPEQKSIEDYEAQRAAFYAFLKDKCRDLIVEGRPALDDRSILSLYCTRSDDRIVTDILTKIINPYAYAYGFRHVRFYLPNPTGSVEHYHLGAEANAESANNWQAFQR